MQSSKSLKTQLVAAAVSVVLSAFALSAATYAWYVANTKVSATTSTISATTNGFILQIDELKKRRPARWRAKVVGGSDHGCHAQPVLD